MISNPLGKLWALPVTSVGLLVGLVSIIFGAKASVQHNAVCFEHSPFVSQGYGITIGNTIHTSVTLDTDILTYLEKEGVIVGETRVTLGDHEEGHTYQYEKYGIFFPLIWFYKGSATSNNTLETDADAYALKKEGKSE